jgi:serine/threonine protein kinase/Tfp pilus assembly protein PilF
MSPERWERVRQLFHRAIDLPPDQRTAFLNLGCPDASLRADVEILLTESNSGPLDSLGVEGFREAILREAIQGVVSEDSARGNSNPPTKLVARETEGTLIGRYRLMQKIGEGGMGEVWLADQKGPVRRRVALKLVKAGMNTAEVIARFESERQALALMEHPAISKVLDAGSTPDGTPYFVMEYVAGVPITAYCDNHRLNTRERLDLFLRVCEGVQHAHQKAIIHRDLKPSNILVTEVDGKAAPKIIDFGVAKALTQRLIADTIFTRAGAIVGTPEYMSPEQALFSGEDIDTRTDVYSLGIIFYELLAGTPPLQLRKIAFEEFLRRLREEEPPKPSTKIRTQDRATSVELARRRQTEPLELAKLVRGDLDSIALKALEKERSRRYGSPSDFAADIARYLKSEPVLESHHPWLTGARKFARRYRVALVMACAFLLVLVVATVVSIRQGMRANSEAAMAQAVNDFLQNDLLAQASAATQSGASAKPDPHLEVRTALDRAAARITGKFDRQPEVEAAIRNTIGETYMNLGIYPEARKQLLLALDLSRRALGANSPRALKIISRLGRAAFLEGKYPEPEALFSQALESQRRVLGSKHIDTLYSMNDLANAYAIQGKFALADPLYRQTLDVRGGVLGPEHPDTLATMNNLGISHYQQGKYAQAEALFSQTLEIRRRVLGPEHPDTLRSMNNLAIVYDAQGKYAQAEALDSQTVSIERRVLGSEHPEALRSMGNLANLYYDQGKYAQGKYAQAEALDKQSLQIQRRVLGLEHPDTLASMNNLANVYTLQGRYSQAEALHSQALEIKRRLLGPEHYDILVFLSDFASMYQRQGKFVPAESYAAQTLAGRRRALGSENPDTMASAADLALAYVSERKFVEAEPLARAALEFNRKKQPADWQRFRAESLLGASLAGQKKYAEAEPLLHSGYHGMLERKNRMAVPDQYHLDRAGESIMQLYSAWGQPGKAAEWKHRLKESHVAAALN